MIVLQVRPMAQALHSVIFPVMESQQHSLREVPTLSQEDYELFANIERATKKMTKQDLLKSMGISI